MLDKKYEIKGLEVRVVGRYLPSETEMEHYVDVAREKYPEGLTGITLSCGPEFVSAFFILGEEKKLYRIRRIYQQFSGGRPG